jgi:hypothetical protein
MSNTNQQTTPDQLMKAFEGRSLKSIIIFTVVIHVILVIGTSVPYLLGAVTGGEDSSEKPEQERLEIAAKEATAAMREIAERYDLKPQDLSNRFSNGAPKAPAATPKEAAPTPTPEAPPADVTKEPESLIEQEIKKVEEGPSLPPVEDDDLFK